MTDGITEAPLMVFEIVTALLFVVGLPILLVELIALWRKRRLDWRRASGMLTSAFCLVPATLIELLFVGALVAIYFWVAGFAPWPIATTWVSAALCLLLVDFLYYWEHRLAHQVNVLWALYHSVHHSADHFDQTIALRVSFVDFFVSPLIYLPLLLAGFDPILVLVCFGVVLAWQQWIHTELVGRLPWLDPWLNTPANHRVHHARNPQYLDRNYGGLLIVWDRLFGTYVPEGEAVDYGLVEPLRSRNPLAVHFHVLVKLVRKIAAARSVGAVAKTLLGRPA